MPTNISLENTESTLFCIRNTYSNKRIKEYLKYVVKQVDTQKKIYSNTYIYFRCQVWNDWKLYNKNILYINGG